MSNTQQFKQKMSLLDDIAMIMGSLKTIAMLETQQAKNTVASQKEGLDVMTRELLQFLSSYPDFRLPPIDSPTLLIVFGSERGFCGDFNAQLVSEMDSLQDAGNLHDYELVSVGYRLTSKLTQNHSVTASVAGAGVYGEIESRLGELTQVINAHARNHPDASVALLYHDGLGKRVYCEPLINPMATATDTTRHSATVVTRYQAPLLNLQPTVFFKQLLNEYVLTQLNHILTLSFFSENQIRVQHLESALDQIEEQSEALNKRLNHVRQEQITEELETILLNRSL